MRLQRRRSGTAIASRARRLLPILALGAAAALPGPTALAADLVLEATPLLAELGRPRYAASRCLLPPLLADDGRVVIQSADPGFEPGDVIVALDDAPLDPSSKTALIDRLERQPPSALLQLRVRRRGTDAVVTARCGDSKPYYDALCSAATAAVARDGTACDDALGAAAKLHGLSSVWLRLSMSCRIAAGRLTGDAVWRAEADLYRQRILEVRSTPGGLKRLRHGVLAAVRDLKSNANTGLAEDLEQRYAAALTDVGGQRPAGTDDDED